MTDADKSLARLPDWFVNSALPLWIANGYDHERGGFYETLDFSGAPLLEQPRRARVQARQIYTFTMSALKGWNHDGERLAARAFDYFIEKACPDDGARGCVHSLSSNGDVIDDQRDFYDQAFLLLACAARIKVGDDRALPLANKTIDFLNTELASQYGGWRENDADSLPRRQNPHMHLFEAFMALFDATADAHYLACADKIYEMFIDFFYDADRKVVLEFFNNDLTPVAAPAKQLIEPGHMMEWVWLLDSYEQKSGKCDGQTVEALFDQAISYGADAQGFLIDSVSLCDRTPSQTRRLWPQTEYVKASLVMAKRGRVGAEVECAKLTDRTFQTYLNQPVAGLWCDQYDVSGNALAEGVPASILYHLFEAASLTAVHLKP